ncbi:MAG: hypothetical protein H6935_13465 [Thiobacillus sp.]|nr:hypothetical protein [Thiobacillus sp.]
MNIAKTVKTLCVVGVTSLGLYAGASQADYDGYRGNPYQPAPQAHYNAGFKGQLDQFDARMDNQLQRILHGMESGKLTMKEAIRLLQEHQAISALERQFLRDGRLGPRELFDLDRRLDHASSNIFWEKHDYDRAGFNARHDGWRR